MTFVQGDSMFMLYSHAKVKNGGVCGVEPHKHPPKHLTLRVHTIEIWSIAITLTFVFAFGLC